MKKWLLSVLICSLALAAGLTSGADEASDAKAAIRTVLDAQVTCWNKGDLPGFMTGYWNSPELSFFSGNNKSSGWQATLERYQKKYQGDRKEMGQLEFRDLTIELLGADFALVRGRFQLQMKQEAPTGLFTLVFKKLPAGWRIIHDHTSG